MNTRKTIRVVAIVASTAVALVGAMTLFVTCHALFAAFVQHMRVLFPFFLSPVIIVVGLWWLITPWITIRHYGRGALINLIAGVLTAGALLVLFVAPLLGIGQE